MAEDTRDRRERMVRTQIAARGVGDERVLDAMRAVPREAFVDPRLAHQAYDDAPVRISSGQTLSQPYIVAAMIQALKLSPEDRVLEVGTGSGYAAAVLAVLVHAVYTVERHRNLADRAQETLATLGYRNVKVRHGDGSLGWPEVAPFQAIVVAAAAPEVPAPLRDQLAVGGRLVVPVGDRSTQRCLRVTRLSEEKYAEDDLGGVRFVPLVGDAGWPEDPNVRFVPWSKGQP
ncbi:MAG: protein-L-isoaspartate(D-aspartate) O-methyltransferase [Deltaproteobacteria bacterium]|nr:protein-L-isoaspartate(D-aspartate) O-methyltransferase [Deltaproteobacteria bacterium]